MTECPLSPRPYRVIVEALAIPQKTEGGLHIPDTAKDNTIRGVVCAVGKHVEGIEVGDVVLFPEELKTLDGGAVPVGVKVRLSGKEWRVLHDGDITATLPGARRAAP